MKTHELAQALEGLAELLKNGPNIEFGDFQKKVQSYNQSLNPEEISIGLSHLVALSRFDKQQWVSVIEDYDFPIGVRSRDASRDVLGKLLSYLEENPGARKKLREKSPKKSDEASPELIRALGALLKE